MAQPLMYGLAIEASIPNGQLSLHDYRKFLSQSNDIVTTPTEASRRHTLRRKPATINLNQAKIHRQPQHDTSFNLYSPVSSAPSSPPPLSFCQSVVTLHGDLPTPVSPSPFQASSIKSLSRPSSVTRASASQRIESFSSRLKQSTNEPEMPYDHRRASSDSMLLGAGNTYHTIDHNGTSFEILNPRESLEGSRIMPPESSIRSSTQSGLVEMDQDNCVHPPPIAHEQSLLDSVVRPLSASESAILSTAPMTPPPPIPSEPRFHPSFEALPSVQDMPGSSRPETPQPFGKTPKRTLRQKVSRLFGSAEKKGDEYSQNSGKSGSSNASNPRVNSPQPSVATRRSTDGDDDRERHSVEAPVSHLSLDVSHPLFDEESFLSLYEDSEVAGKQGESVSGLSKTGAVHRVPSFNSEASGIDAGAGKWHDTAIARPEHPEAAPATTSNEEQRDNTVRQRSWRRPNHGPHSSNRHQTLHDALSQLNINRQSGVTYEDIAAFLRSQAGERGLSPQNDDRAEKPWQPETWPEPTSYARTLRGRASEGDISTTAPSTRPSIRPFARQAAAFMAGDDLDSASITSAGTAIDDAAGDVETEKQVECATVNAAEHEASLKHAPSVKSSMRRAISRRARPLSSNPPDLDVPLFLTRSDSSSSLPSSRHNVDRPKMEYTTVRDHNNGSSTKHATSPSAEAVATPTGRVAALAPKESSEKAATGISYPHRHVRGVPEHLVHGSSTFDTTADPSGPEPLPFRGSAGLTGGGKPAKIKKKQKEKRVPGCCCF